MAKGEYVEIKGGNAGLFQAAAVTIAGSIFIGSAAGDGKLLKQMHDLGKGAQLVVSSTTTDTGAHVLGFQDRVTGVKFEAPAIPTRPSVTDRST